MLALHDRPSSVDGFMFFLATELGKTITELGNMPHSEYVQWCAYYTARHAIQEARHGHAG